jgi:hypothetical protein
MVMVVVALIGVIVFFAHRGREIGEHMMDADVPPTAAEIAEIAEEPGPGASEREARAASGVLTRPCAGAAQRVSARGTVKCCQATSRGS